MDRNAANDLIERFANAVRANGHRTISDASELEFETARNELRAALTAAPDSTEPAGWRWDQATSEGDWQTAVTEPGKPDGDGER
jgi:hypothetical protein